MSGNIELQNGFEWEQLDFALALNHPIGMIQSIPEEFVVMGHFLKGVGAKARKVAIQVGDPIKLSSFVEKDGFAYYPCRMYWMQGRGPSKFQIFYRSTDTSDSGELVPVTPKIPVDFSTLSWNPNQRTPQEIAADNERGDYTVPSPISVAGRWNVAHNFAEFNDIVSICLWRHSTPMHFEMHSHVESNHCSPLPPAWVHVWDALVEWRIIKPGYEWQDKLSKLPVALGEGGEIGSRATSVIGERFNADLSQADFQKVFPFLDSTAEHIGCLMPMDMEYMHFNGYFGVPISQVVSSTETETGAESSVRWYCWDKIWGFQTNNREIVVEDNVIPPLYTDTPPSTRGEVWNWMSMEDGRAYESWGVQQAAHSELFTNSAGKLARSLPFYHFDPRRYTSQAGPLEETGWTLADVRKQPIQSSTHSGIAKYFGFKLYTAMGWAPMDPFLKEPLQQFYTFCESDQIPLLNHGTPAGYYTHDRRHYYDLLLAEGKITEGSLDQHENGWCSRFAQTVPGPGGHPFAPTSKKDEHWWQNRESGRIWWYTHHYVSAQSWRKVLNKFPRLKLCLAHFGDSDHLRDNSWGDRKVREPSSNVVKKITLGFSGDKIDPAKTHRFLYDLLELIQPNNSVFVDLSYVILNDHNASKFMELFRWARSYKPILLERILWGTDWPLIATQKPVTSTKAGNMLHRYARGFRNAIPSIPSDFFLRACFLNPMQFLDLNRIRTEVRNASEPDVWQWVDDLDPSHFDMSFQGDKTELFYRGNRTLAKPLTP